jgi:hypothetical protein
MEHDRGAISKHLAESAIEYYTPAGRIFVVRRSPAMGKKELYRLPLVFAVGLLFLPTLSVPSLAQNNKILGGYFEEWSIYYAGYNIANLEQNGVAEKLTHLLYAFANVTTAPAPACAIADSWADYQTPYLPSVSGVA